MKFLHDSLTSHLYKYSTWKSRSVAQNFGTLWFRWKCIFFSRFPIVELSTLSHKLYSKGVLTEREN